MLLKKMRIHKFDYNKIRKEATQHQNRVEAHETNIAITGGVLQQLKTLPW
jgi:hypothetical protein